jgi:hypothetical protein
LGARLGVAPEDVVPCSAKKKQVEAVWDRIFFASLSSELQDLVREVEDEIITKTLQKEQNRLERNYSAHPHSQDEGRTDALKETIKELRTVLKKIGDFKDLDSIKKALEAPIKNRLSHFEKRKSPMLGRTKRIMRSILNALHRIFPPAGYMKYKWHSSHSAFYSIKGKTHDEGEKALKKIEGLTYKKK